jgi:hypothetical protein
VSELEVAEVSTLPQLPVVVVQGLPQATREHSASFRERLASFRKHETRLIASADRRRDTRLPDGWMHRFAVLIVLVKSQRAGAASYSRYTGAATRNKVPHHDVTKGASRDCQTDGCTGWLQLPAVVIQGKRYAPR